MKKKESNIDSIITNAFFQTSTGFIIKFGGLLFSVLLARFLLPELFGIYSLALTIIITLVTFTDFGI